MSERTATGSTVPTEAHDRRRARAAAVATTVVFAANGSLYGNWVTRIPAVRDAVRADPGSLGLALLCLGAASIVAMPTTGALVRRFGSRPVVRVAAVLAACGFTAAGLVPTVWGLGLTLAVTGMAWGVWDVAMNVQGHLAERRFGRELMPRYHACWSGGSILGSAVGAVVAGQHVLPGLHFAVAGVLALALTLVATSWYLPDRVGRPAAAPEPRDAGETGQAATAPEAKPIPFWRVLDLRLALLGLMVMCACIGEGAASDWLALLFTDQRGAAPAVAAAAFTTFTVTMTTGRFLGTNVIERLGRVRALRVAGLVGAVGIACTLAVPGAVGGFGGAALWGLGVSIAFPAAMSAAGAGSRRPEDAIAAVSTVGYGAFLIGPPLIGFLARAFGLGNALWAAAGLVACVVLLASAARTAPRREP